ncbi:lipid A biosynthesis lauroyl acyltransferase [Paraburkholderia bonniea]|uniref:lipid A biosynthesis lauroyl acyltransferase n=1 Tax=Paraburkholderia bonniea TaxID=2152891 RepID=UPI001290CDE2|nr:lipid A biosynthesis lauroyl acyltransferase [Paraburkholderia bonniea]WJF89117.1 lipid A biosynthesis lauroyl acyltransferase [Paraburkholderia bonniea]WJF92433.1 lipid A biosynthesis lauroyl acyltransferase [Paraburkholderia bonniea]
MKSFILVTLTTGLLRLLAWLPYRLVARFGEWLGAQLYRIPGTRRRVVQINLKLCFPDLSDDERERLARAHFSHVIRSYVERGLQWYGSAKTLARLVQVESAIDLDDSAAGPTIFVGFHFVGIEAGCMMYSMRYPVASLYTPMSNALLDQLSCRQRARFGTEMIPRGDSVRRALRVLRSGKPVMLAADMDFGLRDSVFVPFFGVPACTLTSVSRLAKAGNARVVPFITEVLPDYRGYKLKIFEPLREFPSADVSVDARRITAFLETEIERIPAQYYWVHKRFKHRPVGELPVY